MCDRIKIVLILVMLISVLVAWSPVQEMKKLPSVAKGEITREFNAYRQGLAEGEHLSNEEYAAKRAEFTRKHLSNVQTDGLDRKESYTYGDLCLWALRNDKAQEVYAELAKGDDLIARRAYKKLIYMAIRDEAVPAEKSLGMLADFRTRFELSAEDPIGLYNEVNGLASRLNAEGKKNEAVAVVKDEIAYQSFEKPFWSWNIIATAGRYLEKKEGLALLRQYREHFEAKAEERKKNGPAADADKEAYEKETTAWEGLAKSLLARENRLRITDSQAPDFTFTHFFNTKPIRFSELRGKVVVLDFWANWCGPCIGTFPELRKMHEKYSGTDVVIIGVTGFQGSMANHGGERVQNLTREKELELTKAFIEHQDMTWPVAFSTRNCFDIEYGIQAIPTMVIIDKKGVVRLFIHPSSKKQIVELIEKLRSE